MGLNCFDFEDIASHMGHRIVVVTYGDVNAAIECDNCSEVLLDYDKE